MTDSKPNKARPGKEGYALLLVVVLLSAMMIASLAFARTFLNEARTTAETRLSMQSLYAADLGIERALYALHKAGLSSFSEEGGVHEYHEDLSYQVSTRQDQEYVEILSVGDYSGVQRELETKTVHSASIFSKIEMEDGVFLSLGLSSCHMAEQCDHPYVVAASTTANNSCRQRSYYTQETAGEGNLPLFLQEGEEYADCQIGDAATFGTVTLRQEREIGTPYHFAFRAFYNQGSSGEGLTVSTNVGGETLTSNEDLFTDEERGFFSCIFPNTISFFGPSDFLVLQNASADTPMVIDWYAFYEEIPQGIPLCSS